MFIQQYATTETLLQIQVESCILLGYYAASCGNYLLMFRDNLSKRPETSVRIYHYSLRHNPEECSSQLRRGGSLKSRNIIRFFFFPRQHIWMRPWRKYPSLHY